MIDIRPAPLYTHLTASLNRRTKMAALYGGIQGNRGEATRTGSANSGIRSYVQTWDARVTVQLQADGTCQVTAQDWQRGGSPVVLFDGNVMDVVAAGAR